MAEKDKNDELAEKISKIGLFDLHKFQRRNSEEENNTIKLVERIQAGDEDAKEQLFSIYESKVLALVRSKLAPGVRERIFCSSSDVMQSVFFSALKNIGSFKPETDHSFISWIAVIIQNYINNGLRHAAVRRKVIDDRPLYREGDQRGLDEIIPGTYLSPSTELIKSELEDKLDALLTNLPEKQSSIVRFRFFGLSYIEIADILESTEEAVRKQFSRAMEKLCKLAVTEEFKELEEYRR